MDSFYSFIKKNQKQKLDSLRRRRCDRASESVINLPPSREAGGLLLASSPAAAFAFAFACVDLYPSPRRAAVPPASAAPASRRIIARWFRLQKFR
uniref:Uncharacterized protein n=1 Tax=Leersia perrieri TaxID=77586 RepID=A0A0D9UYK8_9ORYZ